MIQFRSQLPENRVCSEKNWPIVKYLFGFLSDRPGMDKQVLLPPASVASKQRARPKWIFFSLITIGYLVRKRCGVFAGRFYIFFCSILFLMVNFSI
jgi:hypothetical protein